MFYIGAGGDVTNTMRNLLHIAYLVQIPGVHTNFLLKQETRDLECILEVTFSVTIHGPFGHKLNFISLQAYFIQDL